MLKQLKFVVEQCFVYGTTANVAGAAIRHFRIDPSLSDLIESGHPIRNSNLEASQISRMFSHKILQSLDTSDLHNGRWNWNEHKFTGQNREKRVPIFST